MNFHYDHDDNYNINYLLTLSVIISSWVGQVTDFRFGGKGRCNGSLCFAVGSTELYCGMTENIKVLIRVKPLPEGSENCLQIEGQRISVVPGGIQANDTLKNTFQNTTLSRREVIMTPQRAGNIRPRLSFSARELDNEHDLSTARSDTAPIKLYAKERQTPRKKRTKSTGDAFSFQFDRVLTQNASQTEVFHEIQPFIIDAVKGFNTSIFAYG